MYIVYGGKFTRTLMVEMVMAEIGIDHEMREVDTTRREQLSPEFLAINPAGWVPALITPEGDRLYETQAINLYLAERHGATHLAPAAGDPLRGTFLSALFYLADELEPAIKRYFFPHRYAGGEADAPVIRARAFEACRHCLRVIDGRLSENGPFHLGERFSLADIVLAYWSGNFEEPHALDDVPAVRRCATLVSERPKLGPVFEKQAAWMEEFHALRAAGGGVR